MGDCDGDLEEVPCLLLGNENGGLRFGDVFFEVMSSCGRCLEVFAGVGLATDASVDDSASFLAGATEGTVFLADGDDVEVVTALEDVEDVTAVADSAVMDEVLVADFVGVIDVVMDVVGETDVDVLGVMGEVTDEVAVTDVCCERVHVTVVTDEAAVAGISGKTLVTGVAGVKDVTGMTSGLTGMTGVAGVTEVVGMADEDEEAGFIVSFA